jgi:hypothetical protein
VSLIEILSDRLRESPLISVVGCALRLLHQSGKHMVGRPAIDLAPAIAHLMRQRACARQAGKHTKQKSISHRNTPEAQNYRLLPQGAIA